MGHYAKVKSGVVDKVIVAEASFFTNFVDTSPGTWLQTSYNTRGGVHYQPNSNITSSDQSKALRGNYAGIGYEYDSVVDAFFTPKPFSSWLKNTGSFSYEAPITYPTGDVTGSFTGSFQWNEDIHITDSNEPKILGWVTSSLL
tara:strand:- start:1027 stop:1455 length:429 start_codon:yes stop_codon:yes gene_type:complete